MPGPFTIRAMEARDVGAACELVCQLTGRALADFAEQLARAHGCIGTWLVSGLQREQEAHRFYQQLGYAITGYRFVKLFEE
jgi:GNAT superfamily N-acetyltransferase